MAPLAETFRNMSGISTHVLDLSAGRPAAGIAVQLWREEHKICSGVTDENGRCPSLLPPTESLAPGIYRLMFDVAERFADGFYPEVSVSFLVRDTAAHYHVPLLLSPYGFTTYRGS